MKKNKKIIIIIIVFIILLSSLSYFVLKKDNNVNHKNNNKIKIIKNETSKIEYENYDNKLVSMKIPKGWKVNVGSFDYVHYAFMIYNPKNTSYKIFFNMKSEGYLKTEEMKNWYKQYYSSSPMAILPSIDPQTTEQFYKIFTEEFSNENTSTFTFPTIKEFHVIESIGTNTTGGEIVRATYKDENEKTVDGIFTATIKEVSLYYVTALNVYNTIFYTTPENELTEWQNILNNCVSSIKFSDSFVSGFNSQEQSIMASFRANQEIYDEMTDIITSGWEERQNTYDIISQKQSDATLGYERVYDVDTNEIYKATNGFMDSYKGTKYKTITDNMYNLPTAGYIE